MRNFTTSGHADSLAAIVAHYRKRYAPDRKAYLDRYRAMPDLKTAIHHAAIAIREDGKMESHQWRVGRVALHPSGVWSRAETIMRFRPRLFRTAKRRTIEF